MEKMERIIFPIYMVGGYFFQTNLEEIFVLLDICKFEPRKKKLPIICYLKFFKGLSYNQTMWQ
jgi:hypothetical protein